MRKKLAAFVPTLAALFCLAVLSSVAMAQPGGGRGGPPGGGFGGGPGGGGMLGLLMNEDVRKELQVVDDQMEQLKAIGEDMRDEMRSMFEGIRDLPEDERREKFTSMREKMEEMREKMETKASTILLPHQIERLKQIQVQSDVQRRGVGGALESGSLAEQLNLTAEQKEKLAAKAKEAQENLQEKMTELRRKAQDEVLSVLTPEQREKYKKLVGDPFEMQNSGFGGFTGRQGGGRPGGDNPQGGGRPGGQRGNN